MGCKPRAPLPLADPPAWPLQNLPEWAFFVRFEFRSRRGLGLIYYVAPDVKQQWVWITPGAVLATTVWLVTSLGFKWYVSAFANYQATYGAIGGVVVALLCCISLVSRF